MTLLESTLPLICNIMAEKGKIEIEAEQTMSKEVIAALAGAAVGVVLAFILSLIQQQVTIYFRGPKISLKGAMVTTDTNIPGIIQHYINIRVTNTKPRIARECRVYLLKIEKVEDPKHFKTIFDRTAQCIWEYDDKRDSFDIPQDASPAVNVVRFENNQKHFSLCTRLSSGEPCHSLTDQHMFEHGCFRFSGIATADEVKPEEFIFNVEWNGQDPIVTWIKPMKSERSIFASPVSS